MLVLVVRKRGANGAIRLRRVVAVALAMLSATAGAGGASGNPASEWKPGCYIDGRPISLRSLCDTGSFDGIFNGAASQPLFDRAYPNVAIYDTSAEGFNLWGPHGDPYSQFDEVRPGEIRGSGAPDDPFEHRGVFAVGNPRQLIIRSYTEYVNGRPTFESRWEIENVGTVAANFRFTVFADIGIHGQCAFGDLEESPRAIGSFSPEEGVPYDPTDCYHEDRMRGSSGYAIERSSAPWSAFQQGDPDEIRRRLGDASGPGLTNSYRAEPGPEALAIQWDDYGRGRPALGPGETAVFTVGWRFSSDLLATPFHGESLDNVHRVTLTTRFARDGPIVGQRIAYEIRRDLGNAGYTRGVVETNARGIAHITWRRKNLGYDYLTTSFDANGDGRIQDDHELFRRGVLVRWDYRTDRYPTRLTFATIEGGFTGRIRAIHETDPDFGADCRSSRTVAIRQRVDGRDPTLGSAVTNRRGFYDLLVPHGQGDYYAVALGEWRALGAVGPSYRCRRARAG